MVTWKTAAVILSGVVVVYAMGLAEKTKQSRTQVAGVAAVAAAPVAGNTVTPRVVAPAMPTDQSALVQINQAVHEKLRAATNDLQKGALRPWRGKATCMNIKTTAAKDWVGTLEMLSTNNDGKGVVKIVIGDDLAVKTWNNALSDVGSDTLIEPGSSLYEKIVSLNEGDTVVFSGHFFQSDVDCLQEGSVTLSGSLSDPEYIMRFDDIRKAN